MGSQRRGLAFQVRHSTTKSWVSASNLYDRAVGVLQRGRAEPVTKRGDVFHKQLSRSPRVEKEDTELQ